MPREADISLNEREFVLEALREGIRMDDRAMLDYRSIDLQFGDEYGHTEVRLGKTRLLLHFLTESSRASSRSPLSSRQWRLQHSKWVRPRRPRLFLTILPALFHPLTCREGRPTTTETLLSRLLEKAIRRSSALDTESLCLVAGIKCFAIRADIHVLAHDGNLLDAACISLLAALQHFRRPDTSVEGEEVTVWDPREREPVRLSLLHHPLCVSFSYFDSGEIVVVDANALEEKVREGEMVITINRFGEVCQIAKYGGVSVDAVTLLGWTQTAADKAKTITEYISKKLAEDEKKRDKGGLMAELSAENQR